MWSFFLAIVVECLTDRPRCDSTETLHLLNDDA